MPAAADESTDLHAIATTAVSSIPAWVTAIERGHVQAAIAATAPGTDVLATVAPAAGEYSVGFDDGQNVPSGLTDYFGTRSAIVTTTSGAVFTRAGAVVVCALPDGVTTASGLLAVVGADLTCPTAPVVGGPSAITTMWAWGNSVDPEDDARGLGQAGMAPAAIAAFAVAHDLDSVYLSVPWAANEGAIAPWLAASVDALHAEGITVSALGGDTAWLATPTLATEWVTDALDAADFDAVQFDVEPWTEAAEPDWAVVTPLFVTMLDDAAVAAGDIPIGLDLPWWLTTKTVGTTTVFDTLLGHVDSAAIVAFSDHALGTGGIVPLSAAAVASCIAASVPFTIGVETDTPAVAGGAEFTFYDEGSAVLETEVAKVRDAYGTSAGYRGVTVEHLLSWSTLAE